ncbi:MAG: LytTR family DNA-binding domain-containing protein [Bacteroidota bacterium]|nr:LytTR family DNA-binding domain-containing protein [Bacteroidota bacterium]
MIKAIIVDDEPFCCEALDALLNRYCPQVKVVGICYSGREALQEIKEQKPQLLFLDIEMPKMNGFDLLQKIPNPGFDLIFTTSYDQYAIKAFRFSAMDYLLKPIDRDELQAAVHKVTERNHPPLAQQLELLIHKIHLPASQINKVALPTMEGLQMVTVDSIIRCESDSNYTIVFLKNQQKIVVSRTLKDIEELLEDYPFLRIHHSYLVNINEINKYLKGEGGYVVMSDGSKVDVSRSKKDMLLKTLLPAKD